MCRLHRARTSTLPRAGVERGELGRRERWRGRRARCCRRESRACARRRSTPWRRGSAMLRKRPERSLRSRASDIELRVEGGAEACAEVLRAREDGLGLRGALCVGALVVGEDERIPWTGSSSRPPRARRRPRRRRRASSSRRSPSCGRARARPRGCGRASPLLWRLRAGRSLASGGSGRRGISDRRGVGRARRRRRRCVCGMRQTPSSSQRGLRKSVAMRRRCDDIATKKRSASGASSGPLRR